MKRLIMARHVVYYIDDREDNPVWDFVSSLPTDERNKCFEYIAYLEKMGEQVRRPVGDYLGNKLYEAFKSPFSSGIDERSFEE